MRTDLVILGVGNLLMSDDGVGIHAARRLAPEPPGGACVVDAGTDFLSALLFLERARRVLVLDAVRGGAAPGTLHRLGPDDVALRPADGGAHLTSVLEARRFLPPDGTWPEIEVLGVEPQVLDYGLELSPSVAAALPALEAAARRIICDWSERSSPSEPIQAAS